MADGTHSSLTAVASVPSPLDKILKARSVAVVGASADTEKLGHKVLASIIRGGFEGAVHPVNPKGGRLLGLDVTVSLADLPAAVDLVVVAVPAPSVAGVLRQAGQNGIAGAVILTAGFREAGREDLENELACVSREYGIRLVGPNVQGVAYLPNRLCAMFHPVLTVAGPLAFLTQSGSATAALSEWAEEDGVGVSAAINLGNQVDLDVADYLDFLASDGPTRAIAMYLEGVGDGRRFLRALSRAVTAKPVIVLKAGRSDTGRQAVGSHTGALAGSHRVFCAACRQAGAIVVDSLDALFDCAKGAALVRTPSGRRVVSISTSGGMGALAADAAEDHGLEMPPLPASFVTEMQHIGAALLSNWRNPLDLGFVPVQWFEEAVRSADRHDAGDVMLLNLGDPVPGTVEVAGAVSETIEASMAVSYAGGGEEERRARRLLQRAGVAVFPDPQRALRGISAAVWRAEHRCPEPVCPERPPLAGSRTDCCSQLVPEPIAASFLAHHGIGYVQHGSARDEDEAVRVASAIGFPVVLKAVSADILHKTEVGGVALDVADPEDVRSAFRRLHANVLNAQPDATLDGVLIARMAPPGVEIIVGGRQDDVFGTIILVGMGGVLAEVFDDVAIHIAPISRAQAAQMLTEFKGHPLLSGVRGRPACDLDSVTDLVLGVSEIMIRHPAVRELDLNPVRVLERGTLVLDVRMLTEPGWQPAEHVSSDDREQGAYR